MKTKILSAVLGAFCVLAVLAADLDLKISLMTSPPRYLRNFPLDEATQDDVFAQLGVPDETLELGGRTMWSYEYGSGMGLRTFTFVITEDGAVYDVIYNDQGRYNGRTARGEQELE